MFGNARSVVTPRHGVGVCLLLCPNNGRCITALCGVSQAGVVWIISGLQQSLIGWDLGLGTWCRRRVQKHGVACAASSSSRDHRANTRYVLVHWDRCPLPRRGDLIALLPFCSCPSACLCLSAQVQQPGSLALPHSRSSHSHSRASLLGPRTESSEASVRSHADGMSRPCPSER